MLQLAMDDRADILQNVRWQDDLLHRLGLQNRSVKADFQENCKQFIASWDVRKVSEDDCMHLIRKLVPLLEIFAD